MLCLMMADDHHHHRDRTYAAFREASDIGCVWCILVQLRAIVVQR